MWVFGHLGIGSRLARPLSRGLPVRWLLLGTLLPDLIDKPLFFVAHGLNPDGLISCTRTFGHSGLFIAGLTLFAVGIRSRALAALALGAATHLLLDGLQEAVSIRIWGATGEPSMLMAILYPFYRARFALYPFHDMKEHAQTLLNPLVLAGELLGVSVLYRDFRRLRLLKKTKNSSA